MVPARSNRLWLLGPLCLVLGFPALLALATFLGAQVQDYAASRRGVETGLRPHASPIVQPRFATNISLEQYPDAVALDEALTLVKELGIGTIRQRLAWSDVEPVQGQYRWETWDLALERVHAAGLDTVLVLDTSPSWARPAWEADNPWAPPTSIDDYVRFVKAVASRYGHLVYAYQIWDSPNIAPHWGKGPIDPAGYVRLLGAASQAIRSIHQDAIIIAGGLAPNLEPGGQNMSDVLFLREIYRRGAGECFDVLGAKAYGFWTGPEDRRVDPAVLNYSRIILLREEMRRRGEAHKPIWALESGWCALPGSWAGEVCPLGSDLPLIQIDRTSRALDRMQKEWPWLGLAFVGHLAPDISPQSYLWGYALQTPEGELSPLGEHLGRVARDPTLYPGAYLASSTALQLGAEPDTGLATVRVWGTETLLTVEYGLAQGSLDVAMPGPAIVAAIDLKSAPGERDQVRIRLGSEPAVHEIQIRGTRAERSAIAQITVGSRSSPVGFVLTIGLVFLGMLVLGLLLFSAARRIPWRLVWVSVTGYYVKVPSPVRGAISAGAFWLLACAPSPALRLFGLSAYVASACLQPKLSLMTAMACIPFAPIHTRLGPGSFSLAEVSLWSALGAHLWNALFASSGTRRRNPLGLARRLSLLDWCMLALLVLGVLSSLRAEYRRVAFRELRTVILGAVLLYYIVRRWANDPKTLTQMADVLWGSAAVVAGFALLVYPTSAGVIEAEGVRRAVGFFGSPNNLALYLERLLPLGLAAALGAKTSIRRFAYAGGAIIVLTAALLTFSRGAWLLGLPAGALVLAVLAMRRRKVWWVLGLGLLVTATFLVVSTLLPGHLLPDRFATLLDLGQGTTGLRLRLWRSSLAMLRDHLWFGVGPDNFLYYYGDYVQAGAEADRWLSHPHNLLLDFWLRLGVGGVMALAILALGSIKTSLLIVRRQGQQRGLRALALGMIAGLAAAAMHGMVDASFFVVELALWLALVLAWLGQVAVLP